MSEALLYGVIAALALVIVIFLAEIRIVPE